MNINYFAVAVAAVAQFVVGAIWYMPLFGSLWRDIHGFGKLTKAQQEQSQKEMMPMLGIQFAGTVITTIVLARFMELLPQYSAYSLAGMAWLGFVVPIQVSAIMFGGTEAKWMVKKTLVMTFGALACLMVAAAILTAL